MNRSTRKPRASKARKGQSARLESLQPENRTFTCFPKLPQLIQEQIWLASILPRWVTIVGLSDADPENWFNHSFCSDPVPVLSRICQQSRKIFLREYRLYIPFRRDSEPSRTAGAGKQPCYVNAEVDTVYLNLDTIVNMDNLDVDWGFVETQIKDAIAVFAKNLKKSMQNEASDSVEASGGKWQIRKLGLPSSIMIFAPGLPRKNSREYATRLEENNRNWETYQVLWREHYPKLEEAVLLVEPSRRYLEEWLKSHQNRNHGDLEIRTGPPHFIGPEEDDWRQFRNLHLSKAHIPELLVHITALRRYERHISSRMLM